MSDTRSGYRLMMVVGLLGVAGAVAACVDDDSGRHSATMTERTTTTVTPGAPAVLVPAPVPGSSTTTTTTTTKPTYP